MHEIDEALPMTRGTFALFLDVDGTLIDIAETPDAVLVPPLLPGQLARLSQSLNGALALVSGRSIASLDTLFGPYKFAAAGLHGMEMRSAPDDPIIRAFLNDKGELDAARDQLKRFAKRWPGLIIEDKGIGFAVHFRRVPKASLEVDREIQDLMATLGPEWTRQDGKMVVEIRPSGSNKADAVEKLMKAPAFRGRTPITIGDDLTDESMFAYANDTLGRSVRVGRGEHQSNAQFTVRSPEAIREWVARLAATSPP